MSYRIDLSALTVAELDDVASRLAAGVPHEQVAAFVEQCTTAAYLRAAAAHRPLAHNNDQPAGHLGGTGDDYDPLLSWH
jgi:hypothetical protein